MRQPARIEAEVTFLPEAEGGRTTLPSDLSSGGYRPHIVLEDQNQMHPVAFGSVTEEAYLGVAFVSAAEQVEPGVAFRAELALLYCPHPMYDALVPGATFTIREGSTVVGYGQVKKIVSDAA